MANFLYAWELGGGWGHVLPFRPVARELVARGHKIVASLRIPEHGSRAFGDLGIPCLSSPFKTWRTPDRIEPLLTYAHILNNTGWSRVEDLARLIQAWDNLFQMVRPDVVICDHSPATLLALRGSGVRHASLGTGFYSPPDESPLPNFVPQVLADPEQLLRQEQHVLQIANDVLSSRGQPRLERLSQIYSEADDEILATFAELDHFPQRMNGRYVGCWPNGIGEKFVWPSGHGPKVFAYVKDFPALNEVMKNLSTRGWPTVVVAPGLVEKLLPFASPSLTITDRPLDLQQVAREANLVIQHAGHGMLAELLLAGTPLLSLPLTNEQAISAENVVRMEAGLRATAHQPDSILRAADVMLQSDRFRLGARRFAERYAAFDSKQAITQVVERLLRLVP